jgi:hypothetical protein
MFAPINYLLSLMLYELAELVTCVKLCSSHKSTAPDWTLVVSTLRPEHHECPENPDGLQRVDYIIISKFLFLYTSLREG